ncbi:MAG: tRNA epoxyqueuosine(34) reductase QueG [Planctomycetes bacterium]|nr:tRNA epoxyqueuosine(34) reductase QueG [Planctomycetota bacterium]
MTSENQTLATLHEAAAEVGLVVRATQKVGALPNTTRTRLRQWALDGRAGEMDYLVSNTPLLEDPRAWKSWAKSMVIVALPYAREAGSFRGGGRVARYAMGRDYHNLIGKRLIRLGKRLRTAGLADDFRACTDAAPIAEREWAIESRVGWRGKNTLVLDPEYGPWVLLGELLVDQYLPEYRAPKSRWASCGTCTRCLEVCPTGALDSAWSIAARLCLSYLTIELNGAIPTELRSAMGEWVFGCDLCLEVCPFGDQAGDHSEEWGRLEAFDQLRLEDLLSLDEASFLQYFQGSPIRRPGRAGLARNACVVLGNLGRGEAELAKALETHDEPLVRGHAAWALGQIGERAALQARWSLESDRQVRSEIEAALEAC